MFYNKTVTDELGITMKDNMNLDEFIDIAKEVTEKTGYRAKFIQDAGYRMNGREQKEFLL